MGTSGAFGGSNTKPWKKMRLQLDELIANDPPDRDPDPDSDEADPNDPPVLDVLVGDIAAALCADDPRVRPGRPIRNASPSDAVTALLGHLRAAESPRGRASRAASGRRDLGGGARSAGRAVYAGLAARRGDAAAVGATGVRFGDLTGKDWVDQVLIIADTVIGASANADEHALRAAVVEVLLGLDTAEPDVNETEVLRDVVAAYVVELAVVELAAALTAREISDSDAAEIEDDVRGYIEARRDSIAVPAGAVQTVTDFEDAAELLMQEVLLILRAGGSS